MYKALSLSAMGMKSANLAESIQLAVNAGYEGLEVDIRSVANLMDMTSEDHVKGLFVGADIRPAGWSFPLDWRTTEDAWNAGLVELPRLAKAAQSIGCPRTFTWIMPGSNDLTLDENRRFHIARMKPISEILLDNGCSFGLEFIGPKTLRDTQKFPFIHTMDDMLEMTSEIGSNMGILLDCFHWYTSGGTTDDIRDLCTPDNVVYVHVNDAPPRRTIDEQLDKERGLPGATGVIDIRGFLMTLEQIGYEGPVVPEPFGDPATWAKQSLDLIWNIAGF